MGSGSSNQEKRKITDQEMLTALKSICKISKLNKISFGFLIKFFKNDKDFYCLMTNEHIITQEMINKKEKITFYYDNDKIVKEIFLNSNERYIKDFKDMNIDATVIEILPKDDIDKNYFLLPAIDYIYDYEELINKEIILMQNLYYFSYKIKSINNYEFTYIDNNKSNKSGNPIFLIDNMKVIGIVKNDNCDKNLKNVDFIGPIFNFFKNFAQNIIEEQIENNFEISNELTDLICAPVVNENDLEIIDNTDDDENGHFIDGNLEGKGKYIWKNGIYYIGQFKNGKKEGKGIIYYKNGNIMYEGDFVNNKKEGNGKYFYKNGPYYIGQFKNGKMNGNGIIYSKNGNIIYEGDFVNNKKEGNGNYFYKNGPYYIGSFKSGKRNGKGIIYYKNGNIMYEGDFINGKLDGNGKLVYKNGPYYIGQFKNGKINGIGIDYYKNGNIMYEGEFINGKYEGHGKYIWKNGEYYIGQFKNGKRNGKGIKYYKNGNIKYTTNIE